MPWHEVPIAVNKYVDVATAIVVVTCAVSLLAAVAAVWLFACTVAYPRSRAQPQWRLSQEETRDPQARTIAAASCRLLGFRLAFHGKSQVNND